MTQTLGQFLLETAELVRKAGTGLGIPVGKPVAEVIKNKYGKDALRNWVDDARSAMEMGLTPKEYASEIIEKDVEEMLGVLK